MALRLKNRGITRVRPLAGGLAAWMALWWITEPVPLAATTLLPAGILPALGVASARDAVAPYANELVFLFLGGFLLAAALERWNAHARIAYGLIAAGISVAIIAIVNGIGDKLVTAFTSIQTQPK